MNYYQPLGKCTRLVVQQTTPFPTTPETPAMDIDDGCTPGKTAVFFRSHGSWDAEGLLGSFDVENEADCLLACRRGTVSD